MTGQIAFARTLRALDADNFRRSKLSLLLAIAVLALWTWWMFAARIPQYEVANTTQLDLPHNSASADFPRSTHIQPGQHAQITSSDGGILQAEVVNVRNEPNGPTHITFNLFQTTPVPSYQPPATSRATASVEVTRISPAALVLRSLR